MMPSRDLTLEPQELMLLEAKLTPSLMSAGDAEQAAGKLLPDADTCLKIGLALLEAHNGEPLVTVALTEAELWMFRERVSIADSMGSNAKLGLLLKLKIYAALGSIRNSGVAEDVLGGMGDAECGEPEEEMSAAEIAQRIRRWESRELQGEKDAGASENNAGD